jgi:hypothetical protein
MLYPNARSLFCGLGVGEFEIDFDVAAGIEAGNGANGRGEAVVLRVDFVVDVGIESAKTILAGRVGNVGSDGLRFRVEQIDDAGRHGIVALVEHLAVDGAQFGGGVLGTESEGKGCEKRESESEVEYDAAAQSRLPGSARGMPRD